MGNIIIIAILAVIVFFAVRGAVKHAKGEGGCCSGGGCVAVEEKTLEGEIVAKKVLTIEGMRCENCKNSIERSINRIDGAAAKVNLKKKNCEVLMDREISDDAIRLAVERLDYKVLDIKQG